MNTKADFSGRLDSFELQAIKNGCLEDWNDNFYTSTRDFFANCKENNKRATITNFKKEIIQMAKSEPFNFK